MTPDDGEISLDWVVEPHEEAAATTNGLDERPIVILIPGISGNDLNLRFCRGV